MKQAIFILMIFISFSSLGQGVQPADTAYVFYGKIADDTAAKPVKSYAMQLNIDTTPRLKLVGVEVSVGFADDKNFCYVSKGLSTGNITVGGDTMQVIRLMWDEMVRRDSIYAEQSRAIQAAVNFTNTLPGYLQAGKEWKRYQYLLKKQGYKIRIIKRK